MCVDLMGVFVFTSVEMNDWFCDMSCHYKRVRIPISKEEIGTTCEGMDVPYLNCAKKSGCIENTTKRPVERHGVMYRVEESFTSKKW